MTHFIDYHVGAELFVPPLMTGGEGCIVIVSKIEGNLAHVDSSQIMIDCTTNRATSGYREMVFSSKEQYQQINDEHEAFLKDIKFMDAVEWSELDADQVQSLLKIACPDPSMLKPEPFIWHEFTAHQLAMMVNVIESTPCG